ncbi:hypothetical protein E2C01_060475 [Portunus trituberculatus]|uniref:Secreted protein n=1 Tax=Portunus trituberculatus TaxID=210409 RepID=A0A5B7HBI7_PORTR|nr:hypothetical protein [Portunus trituberculatus]
MSSALLTLGCLSLLSEAKRDLYLVRLQASITATPLPPPALTLAEGRGSGGECDTARVMVGEGGRKGQREELRGGMGVRFSRVVSSAIVPRPPLSSPSPPLSPPTRLLNLPFI